MDRSVDVAFVVDTFLLLLIGIGPKIALVPFVETTAGLDERTKRRVVRRMLKTATIVAVVLLGLGEFLARLLHFSPGSLSIAGGIVLLIIAISMILGTEALNAGDGSAAAKDPMLLAIFPLAIPYLLNPVGIVALVTLSAESASLSRFVEKVFGFLLAGLAVQLALNGLSDLGLIHLNGH